MEPREIARRVERGVELPPGSEERFSGYGVMGLPFASGHILGLRFFPASSLGPGYRSVWHRNPEGEWTFCQDVPPHLSCPRYFGSEVVRAVHAERITIEWSGPREFTVLISGDWSLEWRVVLSATPATRLMNAMARMVPGPLWRRPGVLQAMGLMASAMLGAGHLGLAGRVPNGQQFMAAPRQIWSVAASSAMIEGEDPGVIGPLQVQARLGDFWIPQRGIFAVGITLFEAYDPTRHVLRVSRHGAA